MPLGWGTTFRELRVLSKMPTFSEVMLLGWGTTFRELKVLSKISNFKCKITTSHFNSRVTIQEPPWD